MVIIKTLDENNNTKFLLLDLKDIHDKTGEGLHNELHKTFKKWEISLERLFMIVCDGCSSNLGKYQGVDATFKN